MTILVVKAIPTDPEGEPLWYRQGKLRGHPFNATVYSSPSAARLACQRAASRYPEGYTFIPVPWAEARQWAAARPPLSSSRPSGS